jgi:hypothetical protein
MLEQVNRRAADLARTLGIDLVSAMQLAMAQVGSYQAELNRVAGERATKMQELRDMFPSEDEALGGGRGAAADFNPQLTGIDASRRLQETTRFPAAAFNPSTGGGGGSTESPADRLQDAIAAIQARFTAELADAFVRGGDSAMTKLAIQQSFIRAEISKTAEQLMERLGVDLPTALGLAADSVIAESKRVKDEVKGNLQGVLGFLLGRRLAAGLDPGGGLITPSARQLERSAGVTQHNTINITPDASFPGGIDTGKIVTAMRQSFADV